MSSQEVVITGVGVVSPIGIGREPFWESLRSARSGIRRLESFDDSPLGPVIAGEVSDFDPKQYVRPRKSLKVMSRDGQFAVTASDLACTEAGLTEETVDPDRFGVVFGADRIRNDLDEVADTYRACFVEGEFDIRQWGTAGLAGTFPLLMLKNLPNMLASHVSILRDARGPNNTLHLASVSSLLAIAEGVSVIQRGAADVVLAGAASSRMHPIDWARARITRQLSPEHASPAAVVRPFDLHRTGEVRGEGAGAFLLERRAFAEARGATILARVVGWGSSYEKRLNGRAPDGSGLARAIRTALTSSQVAPRELGHVNAHGLSTRLDDRLEAQALAETVPDVPVTALKSYFGNLGPGSGAVELAASILAFAANWVPPTLNYDQRDPDCPLNVVAGAGLAGAAPLALLVNQNVSGQAAALVIGAP
ncbi:MAG: beta-ketoacyl-[acyl-carrier-protein] synthase family protein [Planctomycetaceae bacterium]|nr:beta-ketoacyl-[acyl-carrier-protein] synthase family protein [Planctomycetaceae bacterium]